MRDQFLHNTTPAYSRRYVAKRLLAGATVLACGVPSTSFAQSKEDVIQAHIATVMGDLIALMEDKSLDLEGFQRKFAVIIDQEMDLDVIASYLLGSYGRAARASDRATFKMLVREYIVKVYSRRLHALDGVAFNITNVAAGPRNTFEIAIRITQQGADDLEIRWRLLERRGRVRIFDIMVNNLSLVQTQREEFTSIIRQNGGEISALNTRLRALLDG